MIIRWSLMKRDMMQPNLFVTKGMGQNEKGSKSAAIDLLPMLYGKYTHINPLYKNVDAWIMNKKVCHVY